MITIILAVLLALGVGYIATQNAIEVSLHVGNYLFTGLPLYVVIVGSLLGGLFIGGIFNLIGSLGNTFALRGRDSRLREVSNTNESLQKKVHDLEVENAELRSKAPTSEPLVKPVREVPEEEIYHPRRSFLQTIRDSFHRHAY